MPIKHPLRLAATLLPVLLLTGCGADSFYPAPNGQVQLVPSTEIATGAWFIEGDAAPGNPGVYPIGFFSGAIAANGNALQAGLTIGSTDVPGSYQPAACLGYTIYLTATGTAINGIVTLDSDFASSHLHLVAQLSADHKTIVAGSYVITGACATTASYVDGYWIAPLTGTYTGQLASMSGANPQVTATLTQASYYFGGGYIPVTGNIVFTAGGCNTSAQLNGGYDVGIFSLLGGYTKTTIYYNGSPANNFLLAGTEDPTAKTISGLDWSYPNSGCGADSNAPNSNSILTCQ